MPDIWFYNLGIKFNNVKTVAFSVGGFDIYFYGLCIALAFMAAYCLTIYDAKKCGFNPEIWGNFVLPGIILGVCGARLGYVLFDPYCNIGDFFAFRDGGLQIYGGIITGLVCVFVYTKIKKFNFFDFTDMCARGAMIGQSIGRWGNFFNREAFGKTTDGLFAMRMKLEQVKNVGSVLREGNTLIYNGARYPIYDINGTSYIQAHPTFLYESLWNLSLFLILTVVARLVKLPRGGRTAFYFIGYGIGRFWIESLRTDQLKFLGIPISMAVSFLLIGAGIVILAMEKMKKI